jgi:hypothetical protein
MSEDTPSELLCPICRTILKNAVLLPCCSTCACRTCALKKLMVSTVCTTKYYLEFLFLLDIQEEVLDKFY